ncbi:hypothetical protein LIER_20598 [Lithospermum erythrorhizon]|uniref:F-box domain-containing protein n=1 Tax=Lithospermum erythrorhizon TaxID=34254 RepID=A0AAV3QMZ8_LITER
MSAIFSFSGDNDFFPGGSFFPLSKEPNLSLSLGRHVDVYIPPRKRSRISAPLVVRTKKYKSALQPSIEVLPDECLFEIFRRLGEPERSACASVSKRFLSLLISIRPSERCDTIVSSRPEKISPLTERAVEDGSVGSETGVGLGDENQDLVGGGCLSTCLEGKKATDVRLAAIAIGTGSRGGLGKLSIRGCNTSRRVTNFGLKAIARGSPSLKSLSLWNLPSVGDEGLYEIANGCHSLEKLELLQCPAITDKSLLAIAANCPNLTSISIEACQNIGNDSLQALGRCCPNLTSITIKSCPLIVDQGIISLFSSAGHVLAKVKLQNLGISDISLAVIGQYGKALTDLALVGLQNVNERGFWVMGNGQGLLKLRSLVITACQGMTDVGAEALGNGCPDLKQFCLRKCALISDCGVISFAKAALSLENLQLEECQRITQHGLLGILMNCGDKLKVLGLTNCFGVNDTDSSLPVMYVCNSVRSLSIRNCPGFGDASLALLGRMCRKLTHLELTGLHLISDEGLLPLVESSEAGLVKLNLSGCVNLTDDIASAIVKKHGWTLELLNLDGCRNITDVCMAAIAESCYPLSELDVSVCSVTDSGIQALGRSKQLNLQILSLSGCSFVTGKCMPLLMKLGQTLVGLNIQHCRGISSGTVNLLQERLWRCDILY